MQLEVKIFPTDGSPKIAEKIMEIGLDHFLGPCNSITFEFANKKDANDFMEIPPRIGTLIKEKTVVINPEYQSQKNGLGWVARAIEKNVLKVTEIVIGANILGMDSKTMLAFLQEVQEQIDSVNVQ